MIGLRELVLGIIEITALMAWPLAYLATAYLIRPVSWAAGKIRNFVRVVIRVAGDAPATARKRTRPTKGSVRSQVRETSRGFEVFLRELILYGPRYVITKNLAANSVRKALLHNFHLELRLWRLFRGANSEDPPIRTEPMPVLLVAAPLQILKNKERPIQVWARNPDGGQELGVVEALRACLAFPGIFPPVQVSQPTKDQGGDGKPGLKNWLPPSVTELPGRLDLVNATVVRQNPLPALFWFLEENPEIAEALSRPAGTRNSAVHLVYDCPVERKRPETSAEAVNERELRLPNIVDLVRQGTRLGRRRDLRIEVNRTRFLASLEQTLEAAEGATGARFVLPVPVDEIAPPMELSFENRLRPEPTTLLQHMAVGCRQTLSLLYRHRLGELGDTCPVLLPKVGRQRFGGLSVWPENPGVDEVCRNCTKKLIPTPDPEVELLAPSFGTSRARIVKMFPGLTLADHKPRIVFLASGGVFRGSFHIGMLGAMAAANIRPDLIAGASVGTLMGAVLGTMFVPGTGYEEALKLLAELVDLFTYVDERIALTRPLKVAAKDLSTRARRVALSPNSVRKHVNRSDGKQPALSRSGAPVELPDAISELFIIPRQQTDGIAAYFVDGEVAKAAKAFLTQVEQTTLERLGIEDSVIGVSLLEDEIRRLLGHLNLRSAQPFMNAAGEGPAFIATAVNLVEEWPVVLGSDLDRQARSYDFVKAALASCAFPAAFAPVRDSEIFPGIGRRDVYYGDGGMYDNLPFIPAIALLRSIQASFLQSEPGDAWFRSLRARSEHPDLFLVGALNANAKLSTDRGYPSLDHIRRRANELAENEKIYGFLKSSVKIDRLLERMVQLGPKEFDRNIVDGVVNAAVLPVFPSSGDHLNGTYQFCASTGLDRGRMARSIGDGCFQTLDGMARAHENEGPCGRSVNSLTELGRLPRVKISHDERADGICPFFESSARPDQSFGRPDPRGVDRAVAEFRCPFHFAEEKVKNTLSEGSSRQVYDACRLDPAHRERSATEPR